MRASLLALLLSVGCQGPAQAPSWVRSRPNPIPPSALRGAVQALELLEALGSPTHHVRVHGLESTSVDDPRREREYVRIVLDLTVFARDAQGAEAAFWDLQDAFWSEANWSAEALALNPARVSLAFSSLAPGPVPEAWLSYSNSLRVDVELPLAPPAPGETSTSGDRSPEHSIRQLAGSAPHNVGALHLTTSFTRPAPGVRDVRISVAPEDPNRRLRQEQLSGFLLDLERLTPSAQLTGVHLRPFRSLAPDENYLFELEAELTLRVQLEDDPQSRSAGSGWGSHPQPSGI